MNKSMLGPSCRFKLPRSRIEVWVGWNIYTAEVNGRNIGVKRLSWNDVFFLGELKVGIFKLIEL